MKIVQSISAKTNKDGKTEVLFRIVVGRGAIFRIKSGVFVDSAWIGTIKIKVRRKINGVMQEAEIDSQTREDGTLVFKSSRVTKSLRERGAAKDMIADLCSVITDWCLDHEKTPDFINADNLKSVVEQYHFNKLGKEVESLKSNKDAEQVEQEARPDFFSILQRYITEYLEEGNRQVKYAKVLFCHLKRYETYKRFTTKKEFTIDIDTLDASTLVDFKRFLQEEHKFFVKGKDGKWKPIDKFKIMYDSVGNLYDVGAKREYHAEERGENTLTGLFRMFRRFMNWAIAHKITDNYPFKNNVHSDGFEVKVEKYGTPFFLTIDERNQLAKFDFGKKHYRLSIHRDIFIFQSLIGCRVSDLWRMTHNNIIKTAEGKLAISYIPTKTKSETAAAVVVPLLDEALALIRKYENYHKCKDDALFPFSSQQKYNTAIKKMLRIAGITRLVTILNPTTGEEEQRPICDIASSHMARRCFVGNLYAKIKDPTIISSMSGHKEGSRAFSRYRTIDENTKSDALNHIK